MSKKDKAELSRVAQVDDLDAAASSGMMARHHTPILECERLYEQWLTEFESHNILSCGVDPTEHRPKLDLPLILGACACRPVDRKEVKANQAAERATQQGWDRLRSRKAWSESQPREWEDVAREARLANEEVHVGIVFGFVVEKNTDLLVGDPRRKFKGRVVFQGNNVKNQNWERAVFADLGSSPSSMEARRFVRAFGLRPNYEIQLSDAAQAYLQAKIRGKPTWILLPRDQWPDSWRSMKKPVCRLNVALYGHPDSGTDWEHHCDE